MALQLEEPARWQHCIIKYRTYSDRRARGRLGLETWVFKRLLQEIWVTLFILKSL